MLRLVLAQLAVSKKGHKIQTHSYYEGTHEKDSQCVENGHLDVSKDFRAECKG